MSCISKILNDTAMTEHEQTTPGKVSGSATDWKYLDGPAMIFALPALPQINENDDMSENIGDFLDVDRLLVSAAVYCIQITV